MLRHPPKRHRTFIIQLLCIIVMLLLVSNCASVQRSSSETVIDETEKQMFLLIAEAPYYISRGEYAKAISAYEQSIQLKPDPSDISMSRARRWAQNNLAWLLSTCRDDSIRDGARSLALAEELVANYPNDVAYLDSLAAAYAEVGRFEDAVRTAQEAINNIPEDIPKDDPKVVQFKKHLDMYKSRRPWREP